LDLFVSEHRLDAWVLFASGVSNQVLSSLYCWASLAVNPTLFEGGFPFTFTEAYSVGTPSLLSDIPMVREKVLDDSLRNTMLFDPFNPQDLADKIQWGLMHQEQLVELQRTLFEAFPTWTAVAQRYSESLRR
jgi:glycosyltransferase involved in cell wall biosynthesis